MIKPFVPTNKGSVEDQLEEIKLYLRETSRQLSQADEAYRVIEQIYRSVTEERLDYNNAAVRELWNKLFKITMQK